MKKQRKKLDRDRFCNMVIPRRDECNNHLFSQNSRSFRRRLEQDRKKGRITELLVYRKP